MTVDWIASIAVAAVVSIVVATVVWVAFQLTVGPIIVRRRVWMGRWPRVEPAASAWEARWAHRRTAMTGRRALGAIASGPMSRLAAATDAHGQVTGFGYDGNCNLLTVTDSRGVTTTYTHDSMDRVATRRDPGGGTESFEYDARGNLTHRTDRKGRPPS